MHPADHMSTLLEYLTAPRSNSGGRYQSVMTLFVSSGPAARSAAEGGLGTSHCDDDEVPWLEDSFLDDDEAGADEEDEEVEELAAGGCWPEKTSEDGRADAYIQGCLNSICLASPKSASFRVKSSSMRMLLHFKSLWTNPLLCMYSRTLSSCWNMYLICSGENWKLRSIRPVRSCGLYESTRKRFPLDSGEK